MSARNNRGAALGAVLLVLLFSGCVQPLPETKTLPLTAGTHATYRFGELPVDILVLGPRLVPDKWGGEQPAVVIHYWTNATGYQGHQVEWVDPDSKRILGHVLISTPTLNGEPMAPREQVHYVTEGMPSLFGSLGTWDGRAPAAFKPMTTLLNATVEWSGIGLPARVYNGQGEIVLQAYTYGPGEPVWRGQPSIAERKVPEYRLEQFNGHYPPDTRPPFSLTEAWEWAATNDEGFRAWLDKHPDAHVANSMFTPGVEATLKPGDRHVPVRTDERLLKVAPGYVLQLSKTTYLEGPGTIQVDESGEEPVRSEAKPVDRLVNFSDVVRWAVHQIGEPYDFSTISTNVLPPQPESLNDRVYFDHYMYRIYLGENDAFISIPTEMRVDARDGSLMAVIGPLGTWTGFKG